MSRDHPIVLSKSPEGPVRRVRSFRADPRLPLQERRAQDGATEIIDLAQDDDSEEEVIAMEEAVGFAPGGGLVFHSPPRMFHRSCDNTSTNRGIRGARPRPPAARGAAHSNVHHYHHASSASSTSSSEGNNATRRRSPKRRVELTNHFSSSTMVASSRGNRRSDDVYEVAFSSSTRRPRFDDVPLARHRSEAAGFAARHDGGMSSVAVRRSRPPSAHGRVRAASVSIAAEISTTTTSSFLPPPEWSFARNIHADRHTRHFSSRHTSPVPPSWRPPSIRGGFHYAEHNGTDAFETLLASSYLEDDASMSRGTPAPEHLVSQLPVFAVSEDEVTGKSSEDNDDVTCAICWEDYCRGEHRKLLPCCHSFHDVCLDQWLAINGSCPLCKHRIQ